MSLGRWAGVHVRLHIFFLLLAVFVLHASTRSPRVADHWLAYGLAGLAILAVSVLAHELGHCFIASRVGGSVSQLVIWPLGGLEIFRLPYHPLCELLTAAAGPLVNLLICLVTFLALLVANQPVVALFNPLLPPPGLESLANEFSWRSCLALTFWINWALVIANLVPAAPLDGGRLLRAAIWYVFGRRTATRWAPRAAQIASIALWFVAWRLHAEPQYSFVVMPLVMLGVLTFFASSAEVPQQEDASLDDGTFGYDFSQGYTSLERSLDPSLKSRPGPLRKWIERRRLAKARQQREIEVEDDRRVDAVLARLHEMGMHAMSEEDRALLKRVSARYRNRLQG